VLQCVAVWCDVLQCGVACCKVLQGVAGCCSGGVKSVCSSSVECTVFVCVYACVYAELCEVCIVTVRREAFVSLEWGVTGASVYISTCVFCL